VRPADGRAAGERPRPTGLPLLRADERFVEELAGLLAERVAEALGGEGRAEEGYLDAAAAGRYLGASRKRIHDLTSGGLLVPDGHDGRRPLYLRRSLDRYVRGEGAGR
jgi:hypothetical protein